jgi:riboflavin biosynthesis pyrimidine reductase
VGSAHDQARAVALGELARFRREFSASLTARSDPLFELTDAVLCADGPVKTLVGGHGGSVDFDPAAIRQLKESSARDITIGGAELAGEALAAALVDECHVFLGPIVVGGGKRALPDGVRVQLELVDEHRFRSGVVHLRYGVRV